MRCQRLHWVIVCPARKISDCRCTELELSSNLPELASSWCLSFTLVQRDNKFEKQKGATTQMLKCYMQVPIIYKTSQLMTLITTLNVFALEFLNFFLEKFRNFFTRDLTFSSSKMPRSHRRTKGDFKYPHRSKHMWHTEIILMVHLIFSSGAEFPEGLNHKKWSIQK